MRKPPLSDLILREVGVVCYRKDSKLLRQVAKINTFRKHTSAYTLCGAILLIMGYVIPEQV